MTGLNANFLYTVSSQIISRLSHIYSELTTMLRQSIGKAFMQMKRRQKENKQYKDTLLTKFKYEGSTFMYGDIDPSPDVTDERLKKIENQSRKPIHQCGTQLYNIHVNYKHTVNENYCTSLSCNIYCAL